MNALEFIDQLTVESLQTLTSKTAYGTFVQTVGEENAGTYPYFRTKFNNRVKEVVTTQHGYRVDYPQPTAEDIAIAEEIMEELPTRVTKNYMTGDKIPTLPDLMPTGTLFDEIISDRITTDEEKQAYFDRTGEDMPEEDIHIGGLTRQCVDIVAGDPGKIK